MTQKALVRIQTVDLTAAQEPMLEAVLLRGSLLISMEAIWEGAVIVIVSMETLESEIVNTFADVGKPIKIVVEISDPNILAKLPDQRLTFGSERTIPVVVSINPWQIEPTI